jgi:hypothetical protein
VLARPPRDLPPCDRGLPEISAHLEQIYLRLRQGVCPNRWDRLLRRGSDDESLAADEAEV